MKPRTALAALALLTLAAPAVAQQAPAAAAQAPILEGVPVRDNGLVATWYPPASGKRGPAILVLGGSEGGEGVGKAIGRKFAQQGYGVLAVAYFRTPACPSSSRRSVSNISAPPPTGLPATRWSMRRRSASGAPPREAKRCC